MRARIMPVLVAGFFLGACSHGRNDQAAAACSTELAKRLSGKTYEIDIGDLAKHVKTGAADTVLLKSTPVFDKGLSTEYKQGYECRVRFDSAGTPSVLYMQFNWDTADLKKA